MRFSFFCLLLSSCLILSPVRAQSPFDSNPVNLLNQGEIGSEIGEITEISDEISQIMAEGETSSATENDAGSSQEITVVRGNTLSGLAKRLLGDARRWRDLVEWNQDRYPSLLKNPDLILVGWKLRTGPASNTATAQSPDLETGNTSADTGASEPATAAQPQSAPAETAGSAVNSGSGSSANSNSRQNGGPLITPDSRVLHIGDSHTCGVYGKAMDALMRETGATVRTYGVSGSSPSWWLNETTGKSGYYARDEHGNVDQPADWRTPRQTPNLNRLINEYKPNVIMFSLGANLVHSSPETIRRQVETVCKIAKEAGCQIVWVGPPRGRPGLRDPAARERLYDNLKKMAEQYGTFIDSRNYTRYPETGGDGAHYSGTEGSRIAREWAGQVFNNVQNQPPSQ